MMARDYDKAFAKAIAKFNFKAAHAAMESENWTWWNSDGVPTVDMLIECVADMYSNMKSSGWKNISTGGFGVYIDEDENAVSITFELQSTEYVEK